MFHKNERIKSHARVLCRMCLYLKASQSRPMKSVPLLLYWQLKGMVHFMISVNGPSVLAYIDPGSGSLLLQVMVAGLLSGLFYVKSSFTQIRESLTRVFKRHA